MRGAKTPGGSQTASQDAAGTTRVSKGIGSIWRAGCKAKKGSSARQLRGACESPPWRCRVVTLELSRACVSESRAGWQPHTQWKGEEDPGGCVRWGLETSFLLPPTSTDSSVGRREEVSRKASEESFPILLLRSGPSPAHPLHGCSPYVRSFTPRSLPLPCLCTPSPGRLPRSLRHRNPNQNERTCFHSVKGEIFAGLDLGTLCATKESQGA